MFSGANASTTRVATGRGLGYATAAAYAAIALSLWPSLRLAPISLDDWAELHELSQRTFGHVLDIDRFGHLRPLKSALFWLLSRHLDWLAAWRCLALVLVLVSARLWQLLCSPLMNSGAWALGAAVCWALNPITASSLCWLSSTNLVVAASGSLAYVWLTARGLEDGRASWRMFAAHAGLIAGVLSHELALFAPVLFIVYRYFCLGRAWSAAQRRRSLVLALAALVTCAMLWLGLYAASPARGVQYRFASYPRAWVLLNAPRYFFDNLRLWFWLPGRFGVLLAPEPTRQLWAAALCWVGLCALCGLAWRACRRDAALGFGVTTTGLMLLPLTNFLPLGNTPVALHYLFLPGLGLALVLTRAAQRLGLRLRKALWVRASPSPALALMLLIVLWLPEQRRVLSAWGDARSLYSTTIQNYPDNIEARVNLAAIYLDAKQYVAADELLSDSLRRAPHELGLVVNRFKLLAETGRDEAALSFHDAHPELTMPSAWIVRGMLLLRAQRPTQAAEAFSRALQRAVLRDERLTAGRGLVLALLRAHDEASARVSLQRLIVEFPDHPELLSIGWSSDPRRARDAGPP